MIRKYLAWLFRRPVAAFSVCISFILVLQVIVILNWNWGGDGESVKYKLIQTTSKNQQLPIAKYRGSGGRILGLDPSLQSMYASDSQGMWSCLDKSEVIPFTMVNDDYCDCEVRLIFIVTPSSLSSSCFQPRTVPTSRAPPRAPGSCSTAPPPPPR